MAAFDAALVLADVDVYRVPCLLCWMRAVSGNVVQCKTSRLQGALGVDGR